MFFSPHHNGKWRSKGAAKIGFHFFPPSFRTSIISHIWIGRTDCASAVSHPPTQTDTLLSNGMLERVAAQDRQVFFLQVSFWRVIVFILFWVPVSGRTGTWESREGIQKITWQHPTTSPPPHVPSVPSNWSSTPKLDLRGSGCTSVGVPLLY